MKILFCTLALMVLFFGCSSSQSEYEKVITDFLETKNGVKTDLQIKYSKLDVVDISVTDSIGILKEQFEAEKAKKIQSIEQTIKLKEESIAEQQNSDNKLVASVLIKGWQRELAREKEDLEKAKNWKPDYLTRYDNRNPSDILSRKADVTFSYFNPQLQTRQEMSAWVILYADGKQCYRLIKQQ